MGSSKGGRTKRWFKPVSVSAFCSLFFFALTLVLEGYVFFDPESDGIFAQTKTYATASKELFFAFFISMIIIFTIERVSRQEQAEQIEEATTAFAEKLETGLEKFRSTTSEKMDRKLEELESYAQRISDNVFNALYKSQLAPEFSHEVEESVFRAEFVRLRHERYMVLEPIADLPEKLLLRSTQTFTVKNITRDDRPYVPNVYLPSLEGVDDFHSRVDRVYAARTLNDRDVETLFDIPIGTGADAQDAYRQRVEAEYKYTFQAITVPALSTVKMMMELCLLKDRSDNEIWTSLMPTLRGSVSVESRVSDLHVEAISLHRGSMVAALQAPKNLRQWSYEKPIMPYQGYVVSWRPKQVGPKS